MFYEEFEAIINDVRNTGLSGAKLADAVISQVNPGKNLTHMICWHPTSIIRGCIMPGEKKRLLIKKRDDMDLQRAYEIYTDDLAEELKTLGFVKKAKDRFSRKVGNCRQDICVMCTKGRGIPHHDSIICSVLYSFDNVNRIYYYIQGLPFRKGFPTGRILSIDEDLKYREETHLREHFLFEGPNRKEIGDFAKCMRRENSSEFRETDEELLRSFAKEDAERIQKSYLPLLDKCDTEEKFLMNLEKDILIKHSITYEDSRMWYRIAALLSLGKKEAACKLFDNWEPVSWRPTRKLPEDEKQEVKRRMNELDEKKTPKQYSLFGLQTAGGVLPVDTSER